MYVDSLEMKSFVNDRFDYLAEEYRSAQADFPAVKTAARRILRWLAERRTTKNRTAAIGHAAWQG